MLEQQMYKIPRIKERIYSVRDLESLSASVLYSGDSGNVGSSNFITWTAESQSNFDAIIQTEKGIISAKKYLRLPILNSIRYFDSNLNPVGGIEGLNQSESDYLKSK